MSIPERHKVEGTKLLAVLRQILREDTASFSAVNEFCSKFKIMIMNAIVTILKIFWLIKLLHWQKNIGQVNEQSRRRGQLGQKLRKLFLPIFPFAGAIKIDNYINLNFSALTLLEERRIELKHKSRQANKNACKTQSCLN